MSIARPTADDIAAIATRLGYHGTVADADQYAPIIAGLLDAYDVVDNIDNAATDALADLVSHRGNRIPDPGEDPHNAWYVKTSITGAASGPLAGKTVAGKDSILVAGVPMMNGSGLLEGFIPPSTPPSSPGSWTPARNCAARRTASTSACPGAATPDRQGATHNPHRRGYSAGGSSSGSAVAVVTGDVDLVLGAGQAGSIRVPASYSGLVGLKPT